MQGKKILHYKIQEKIGQGGMGVVYKAEDTKLKRTVALKFLLPHIITSDQEKSRFTHEAQSAAALHHPNICTIHEINEAEGQTFISMAFLEGESLNERIDRGPLKPVDALRFALQIARGLRAAHEKGVIHRDIKSSNIMISDDGRATIMDFGLAKSAHQTHATQRGTKVGTIGYMSPEQTRGDQVDHRTDIWSLGILLYEMVTGGRPFHGDYDEAVIYSILNEEPEPIHTLVPEVWEDIWYAIQRAIAKDPNDRYQTAAELAEDLEVLYDDLRTDSSSGRRSLRESRIERPSGSAVKAIFNNRVFTSLAIYLIAAWAIVTAVSYITNRYVLSPHLTRIALIALFSLLPTVWILAARKRAPRSSWSTVAKTVIPTNVILSIGLLLILFAGREIGAATKVVRVTDETGQPVERVVAKSEFRKSLMVFFFDNETGDDDHIWVGGAMMTLLQVDLYQDEFLHLGSCIDEPIRQRLQEAGFSSWFDAPWSLKRKITEDAHIDYLLTGSYKLEDGAWVVTVRVHDSRSGKLVTERVYTGENLFDMADQASVELRRDIELPEQRIENKQDLPTSEMFTSSMPALRDFCIGIYVALFDQNWPGSIDYMERAVAADTTFSWGYLTLYQLYLVSNIRDKADHAMRAAMQHSYKLPERMQFILKVVYYEHVMDYEKQLGVAQMMIELYPDDITAREIMARIRVGRNEPVLAIEQFTKVLEIDPSRTEYILRIADLYRNMGNYDRAVEAYESYLEKHPDDSDVYQSLGSINEIQGKFDEARAHYEKALLIDPNRASVVIEIGDIEGKLSNDQRALEKFDEALRLAKTPQDRARVYLSLRNFYSNRGQVQKSLEQQRLRWAEQEKYLAPLGVQAQKLGDLWLFVKAGRTQEGFDELETIKTQLAPPYDGLLPLGYLSIYVELKDPDNIEKALESMRASIETYNFETLRGEAYWAEGEMEEARGNFGAAIESYENKLKEDPNDATMHRSIGRCYRKLGRHEDAISSLDKMLQVYPLNPTANYELALVYHELGDEKKAMEHMNNALDRWKNADPEFKPAQEARAVLAEWQP